MRNGTCNFTTIEAARNYYAAQDDDADAALADGRIEIGPPSVTWPQYHYTDGQGRYWIDTASEDAQRIVGIIKALGYRVFIHPSSWDGVTYCNYTDGTRIAYAQWGRIRTCVSTVHKPSKSVGTGFQFAETITPDTLREALECHAPGWAKGGDRANVRKWRDWDEFHNQSDFHRKAYEV